MNIDTIIEGIFEGKNDVKIELRTKKSAYNLEFNKMDSCIGTNIILKEKYSDIAELEEKVENLENEKEILEEKIKEIEEKLEKSEDEIEYLRNKIIEHKYQRIN